tara:strand:- start:64 stop:297 length:234 start_codon:yes stop_codon:yes gene_type:complete
LFKPITKEDGMATFKAKVAADSIRYYKGKEKVTVLFDEVAEFDDEEIYNYFISSGYVVAISETKKATKKKKEESSDE